MPREVKGWGRVLPNLDPPLHQCHLTTLFLCLNEHKFKHLYSVHVSFSGCIYKCIELLFRSLSIIYIYIYIYIYIEREREREREEFERVK